jgi:predicted nicotinamide N-methyase
MQADDHSIRQDFLFGPYRVSLLLPELEHIHASWVSGLTEKLSAGEAGSGKQGFPFWAKVWPAARAMCIYLSGHPDLFRHQRVLEIGAGLGLPSLLCAMEASSVMCTDLSAEAMQFAEASASFNGLENVRCMVLDWTKYPQSLPCDLLLMSDVNYAPEAFPYLLRMLAQYRQQQATILLATPQRLSGRSFAESILPWVSHTEEIVVEDGNAQVPVSIFQIQPVT